MEETIRSFIGAECPWRDTLHWFDSTDSTNLQARKLAMAGAPEGTVVLAGGQSGGRGRLGRSFSSPQGQGVYLSVVLRPQCKPEQLMHLTCGVGVAMCYAIRTVSGVEPGLKWINDLVWNRRKLGGILTELSVDPGTGLVDYAVVGIGINCLQETGDFPRELQDMAASVSMAAGKTIQPASLAAAMVEALWRLSGRLLTEREAWMAAYRARCITLGQDVRVVRGNEIRLGKAVDLDETGGLVVDFADGCREIVNSGEVSVRGMYGYL